MRLIDADKIVYMWKQDINGDFHDGVTLESIVDKTPTVNVNDLIVEELEKIKAKIKEEQSKYTDRWVMGVTDYPYGCYRGYDETIKLIDKHISELKGE